MINELEDIQIETFQNEAQSKNIMKESEKSTNELWDNFKPPNIYVIGVPGVKEWG